MGATVEELQDFLKHYKEEIEQEAELLLNEPMPDITEELFSLFEKDGSRLPYERVYFGRRKFLAVLGLKALLEQQPSQVMERLAQVMLSICGEECWALPAHVNRKEADWRICVDLFAAETAQTLSELADRLRGCLPAEVYDTVVENVERRVFQPFFSSEVPYRNWEHAEHNWNAVCGGAIGSACLHLLREQPKRLEAYLERICAALPYYIAGFAEDGACMEGLGYFTYGMTFFTNFAQELYDYTEGKQDLFCGDWGKFRAGQQDKRSRIAAFQEKCYFPDGKSISFSDGCSEERFRVGLTAVLAMHYPEIELPSMERAAGLNDDTCYRFAALKMDLFRTGEYVTYLKRQQPEAATGQERSATVQGHTAGEDRLAAVHGQSVTGQEKAAAIWKNGLRVLPSAQWCIACAENGAAMACKGGHNDEPHNHNDVGHFLYEAAGQMFLTDLGAGEYTKEYFGAGRYDIFCNQSLSHSVPVINGRGQLAGKEYCCTFFETQERDGMAVIDMNLEQAYPKGLLERFHRRISFSMATGEMKAADEFVLQEGEDGTIIENLVTQIKPEWQQGKIVLQGENTSVVIELPEEAGETSVMIREHDHSNHQGIMEKVYLIQWQVKVQDRRGESVIRIAGI